MTLNECRASIVVVSTRTSLAPLLRAVERLSKQGVSIDLSLFYLHEVGSRREALKELEERLSRANIVLLDIRSGGYRLLDRLLEAVASSPAKLVVPVVAGDPRVLRVARIGLMRGFEPRIETREDGRLDTQLSRVWSLFRRLESSRLASILPVARDARLWALATRYWVEGDEWNLEQLLRMLLSSLGCRLRYEPPRRVVEPGRVYLPGVGIVEAESVVGKLRGDTVAIILYAGMHYEQTRVVADALARELSRLGLNPLPVIGGGAEDLVGQTSILARVLTRAKPVAVVNLQWFRLEGGPYGGEYEKAIRLLKELDSPLFNGLIMYMSGVDEWRGRSQGLSPIEVLAGVALPEADGAIEPIPSAGLRNDAARSIEVLWDRVRRKAERIAAWVKLRRKPRSEKRVAIITYNYPPGPHNIGSASYLDLFASLEALLRALSDAGYRVEPLSRSELKKLFLEKRLFNGGGCEIRVSLSEYLEWYRELPECIRSSVERVWGPPPGSIMVDEEGNLCIPGVILGNVFIGVQPARGPLLDQEKLYHDKDLPPHHQYIAFYKWLEKVFKADAVIHLGTHGTLELLPGKEVGLDECSHPDALIGRLPNIYVYHVTNSSEMSIAKRRSYAYIVTHLPPPPTNAGLSEELERLGDMVEEYVEARSLHPERAKLLEERIVREARRLGFNVKSVEDVHELLEEARFETIPSGLHVLGRRWGRREALDYLQAYERRRPNGIQRLLAEARGVRYEDVRSEIEEEARRLLELIIDGRVEEAASRLPRRLRRRLLEEARVVREAYERLTKCDELGALLHALDAGYLEPRVAGDPLRYHDVLPTGSNGYAFDPRLVPSEAALELGWRLAEELLRDYAERRGGYPETVGLVLWGFETAGTRGETIGLILALLGVRLERKGPWGYTLRPVPLEELGRPRIDVLVTICGFFRDMFPHLIEMIDRAVRLVASLDEPPSMNYVRKHAEELSRLQALDPYARIYGPKPGAYNTRLTELIDSGVWRDEEELVKAYVEDMSYAYTEKLHGVRDEEGFTRLASSVELVAQVRYSNEYDVTDLDHYYEFLGGLYATAKKHSGREPVAKWIDTTGYKPRVRDLDQAIAYSLHTRLLNEKWIDAMLAHDYSGAREVAERVRNILGLATTTNMVPEQAWHLIHKKLIVERGEELRRANPHALREIAKTLEEAAQRGYWRPAPEEQEQLHKILEEAA